MSGDAGQLLALLQHADSGFPSGAVSFSSGLETLADDGLVTGKEFTGFLLATIEHRWNSFDRVYLVRSLRAVDEAQRCAIDLDVDASTFGAEARISSRRTGRALLATWARLGMTAAVRYRELVQGGAPGHLPVVQGIVYAETPLTLTASEAAACWSALTSLAGAGVRLGVVGHVAAQAALLKLRPAVAALLSEPVPDDAEPHAWTPLQDIAVARHSMAELRVFAS